MLIVGTALDQTDVAQVLRDSGYDVVSTDSFEEARSVLASSVPDLLVTDVRLGAYNGLHLVWQRHLDHPGRPSIVTSSYHDSVLESEADRLGCPFLTMPIDEQELRSIVTAVSRGAERPNDRRRWPRTRLDSGIPVRIGPASATLVDVSYGGCRVRLLEASADPLTSAARLSIEAIGEVLQASPVWREPAFGGEAYGLTIGGPSSSRQAWRRFVDARTPSDDGPV